MFKLKRKTTSKYNTTDEYYLDWDGMSIVKLFDIDNKKETLNGRRKAGPIEESVLGEVSFIEFEEMLLSDSEVAHWNKRMKKRDEDVLKKEEELKNRKYYIAFYHCESLGETRGEWCISEKEIDAEIKRMQKVPHLGMKWNRTAIINHSEVVKIAEESNISVNKALSMF